MDMEKKVLTLGQDPDWFWTMLEQGKNDNVKKQEVSQKQTENCVEATSLVEQTKERIASESASKCPIDNFELTEFGNALRLVQKHGRDLKYVCQEKRWRFWDGKRWCLDDRGRILNLAKELMEELFKNAKASDEKYVKDFHARFFNGCQTLRDIETMIRLAQIDPAVSSLVGDFDKDPLLLNVQNGTFDFKTGKLMPHAREKLMTKICPIEYMPKAQCPKWLAFLEQILIEKELLDYIQRAVGLALTGDVSEQVFFILYGLGANGKSTFINVLMSLFGDYAMQTPTSTLMVKNSTAMSNDIARLLGTRFVAATEGEEGQRLSEVLIKRLTGGDKITARFLFKEYFEFYPTFKIFLATNYRPNIKGLDHGIWRRINSIPFIVTIPDDEQNKKLTTELLEELPGILNWALQGYLEWQKVGLNPPIQVRAAVEDYRNEMDTINIFIDEKCKVDANLTCGAAEIYATFKGWCLHHHEFVHSRKVFVSNLESRGFTRKRSGADGQWRWQGFCLLPTI